MIPRVVSVGWLAGGPGGAHRHSTCINNGQPGKGKQGPRLSLGAQKLCLALPSCAPSVASRRRTLTTPDSRCLQPHTTTAGSKAPAREAGQRDSMLYKAPNRRPGRACRERLRLAATVGRGSRWKCLVQAAMDIDAVPPVPGRARARMVSARTGAVSALEHYSKRRWSYRLEAAPFYRTRLFGSKPGARAPLCVCR